MKGIEIKKVQEIAPDDPRGKTIEWCKGIDGKQVSLFYRKKGVTFAEHFHKGDDISKDPERFFIVAGRVRMEARNREGEELVTEISEGNEILISPDVVHKMYAITDVIFLEYRQSVFDKDRPDTYLAEDF